MRRTLFIISGLLLGLVACGEDDSDSGDSGAGDSGAGDSSSGPVPEAFSDCSADDGDPTSVDAAAITGDTLSLDVSYGGGCETHRFQICWQGSFAESAPVQVWLELWHDAGGDTCEAALSEILTFDLTPLKEAWQDAYGAESGEISVHTDGGTVSYTF